MNMKKNLLTTVFLITFTNIIKPNLDVDTNIITNTQQDKMDNIVYKKPKIVVFTSKGGNGHMAACRSLEEALPEFELKIINPIYNYFHKIIDGEVWYDTGLQKGWTRTINFLVRYPAPWAFKLLGKSIQKSLLKILEDEKPDLLISVIPFFDFYALQAAETYKIPFLMIPIDADLTTWLLGMEKSSGKKFTVAVEILTERIKKQLKEKDIPDSYIHEVGYQIRKDFSTPKDIVNIKKEWDIPDNKKIIMLIRGSTGSTKLIKYVEELIKIDQKVHLLVCVGKNVNLIKNLNKIKNNGPVSFSIIPFTSKIPDLMAVSDLIITQPSPNVCKEAIFVKLPILVDMSDTCLFWEEATVDLIKLRGYGDIFTNMNQLNKLVIEFLDKRDFFKTQEQKSIPNFKEEIHEIVIKILNEK
ncbi:hypothetical protein K9L05_03585 [Candidatus Babeliales bacterium]|nr:hypothetical protein [Candidatus Babeliales bacterium]MCF7899699.1 hypothetical protein [Candidatus Babeliales bacterium]